MKSKNVKITVRLTEEVISWLRDFETDRITDGGVSARPTRERKTPGREATLSPPLRVD